MRSVLILIILLAGFSARLAGQQVEIMGFGAGDVVENTYHGSIPFYAVRDADNTKPAGQIRFTPDGSPGWEYSWNYNGGGTQTPVPVADSSSLTVDIAGNGTYNFSAVKNGRTVNREFIIFYVYATPFTVSILNAQDCYEIKIKASGFQPASYENVFPGSFSAKYYLGRAVSGNMKYRDVPVSAPGGIYLPDPELPDEVGNRDREDRDENARYAMKIVDRFGLEWISTNEADYTSVIPVAKMLDPRLLNTVGVEGFGSEQGQAPLEVEFRDDSRNAQKQEWYLYKDTADLNEPVMVFADSLMDNRIRYEKDFNYIYQHPGRYKVQLKVFNVNGLPEACWDTTGSKYVDVVISLVKVPNVFTPNGDGINDVFRAQTLSVESFHGVIINRWGRQVHEWNDPTEGWDGRINGKYATPGTYYYIITARGLEKNNPPKYIKKGALLLVR